MYFEIFQTNKVAFARTGLGIVTAVMFEFFHIEIAVQFAVHAFEKIQIETRGNAFGYPSHEGWLAYAPRLSLLDQGILDKASTSLLCVNGVKDPITPIADYYLVLEHGSPKEARFVTNGAHMGRPMDGSPDPTDGIILNWMRGKLLD